MTKWERMLKRKQARDSFNAKKHAEKIKDIADQKPKKWIRKYKGGWIIRDIIRVSYVGLLLLIILSAFLTFVYFATQYASALTDDEEKKAVTDAKQLVKNAEIRLRDIDITINENNAKIVEIKNKINKLKSDTRKVFDEKEDTHRKYRHSFDLKPTKDGKVDIIRKEAKAKYDKAVSEYDKLLIDMTQQKIALDNAQSLVRTLNIEKKSLESDLKTTLYDKLNQAKVKAGTKDADVKFISIMISKSCMISECMKYSDLIQFDNTVPEVSGKLVKVGDDVKRVKPPMKNYWAWYQQIPNLKIITIDPDSEIISRSSVIEIVPQLVVLSDTGDKQRSINNVKGERYEWHDMHVDKKCKRANVVPDIESISKVIEFMKSDCDGGVVSEPIKYKLDKTPYNVKDSPAMAEMQKWKKASAECVTKCLGVSP